MSYTWTHGALGSNDINLFPSNSPGWKFINLNNFCISEKVYPLDDIFPWGYFTFLGRYYMSIKLPITCV